MNTTQLHQPCLQSMLACHVNELQCLASKGMRCTQAPEICATQQNLSACYLHNASIDSRQFKQSVGPSAHCLSSPLPLLPFPRPTPSVLPHLQTPPAHPAAPPPR
jgi:hypothetical protein